MGKQLELMVTLWPSFSHFPQFAKDQRISGIRLNSAMMSASELDQELAIIDKTKPTVPLYYDIKGRQLRITDVRLDPGGLDISLNHPISVDTPTPVLFKGGMDGAELVKVEEEGTRLIFNGGPNYMVRTGESLHIRDESLKVHGPQFTDAELEKIKKVKQAGFKRYYLSYVENQADVDEFRGLVGEDSEVYLKIENNKGLEYVAKDFKKKPNLTLVAARGDLYVEVARPHQILEAMKLIITKDPEACVGSRLLLSVVETPTRELKEVLQGLEENHLTDTEAAEIMFSLIRPKVPEAVDFSELAWFYDIGYRKMLLCDEICLQGDLLETAVDVFDTFRQEYANKPNRKNPKKGLLSLPGRLKQLKFGL